MSKRFGRNQKRRAREEQARLSQALEMANGLSRHLSEEKRRVTDELIDAKEFAVRFSAAFPPDSWQLNGPRRDRVEVEEKQPFNFSMAMDTRIDQMAMVRRLPLQMLLAEVKEDQFRAALHCRVRFGDGTWGYGITQQAMYSMPKSRLIRIISEQIALQIARDIPGRN